MDDKDLKINTLEVNYKAMAEKIDALTELVKEEFSSLRDELKNNYVSNDKFLPVKLLTYGFAGILFSAVIVAIVANVIK